MTELRVLTVREPWASAIVDGHKPIENRTVGTKHRGVIGIHTSLRWSERGRNDQRIIMAYPRSTPNSEGYALRHKPAYHDMPPWPYIGGQVIGAVEVTDTHKAGEGCTPECEPWGETEYEQADGVRRRDIHHWMLANPVRFRLSIGPVKGRLGLWKADPELSEACLDEMPPVCPQCQIMVVATVCGPGPTTQEGHDALRELLVAMHTKLAHDD